MGGKAKPTKHTAREIARKTAEANTNKGGGAEGLKDRLGGPAGHSRFICHICKAQAPDLKTMEIHFESKHPKETFKPDDFTDLHEQQGGVTTAGVAVRGSTKK